MTDSFMVMMVGEYIANVITLRVQAIVEGIRQSLQPFFNFVLLELLGFFQKL